MKSTSREMGREVFLSTSFSSYFFAFTVILLRKKKRQGLEEIHMSKVVFFFLLFFFSRVWTVMTQESCELFREIPSYMDIPLKSLCIAAQDWFGILGIKRPVSLRSKTDC